MSRREKEGKRGHGNADSRGVTAMFLDAVSPSLEPFTGELGQCRGLLLQCLLAFGRSSPSFPKDTTKLPMWLAYWGGKRWRGLKSFSRSEPNDVF